MATIYGYERYERARHYFEDGDFLDAARELEELLLELPTLQYVEVRSSTNVELGEKDTRHLKQCLPQLHQKGILLV